MRRSHPPPRPSPLWLLLGIALCVSALTAREADAQEDVVFWGWQDPPAGTTPMWDWPTTGAAFYWSLGLGGQWTLGQFEEVFNHGGLALNQRYGVAWERWIIAFNVDIGEMGSRIPDTDVSRVGVGAMFSHRLPLTWTWHLLLGAGAQYNWLSLCIEDADECIDPDDPRFDPHGPSLELEIGLSWVVAHGRSYDPDHRIQSTVFTSVRASLLWLDNLPADRTIEGPMVMWMLGYDVDIDEW